MNFPDGEMAVRVRNVAFWDSMTPTVRAAITTCLAAPTPMFVWCDPAQSLIYNDAAIRFLGDSHPDALGRTVPDDRSERWRTIRSDLERVSTENTVVRTHDLTLHPIEEAGRVVAVLGVAAIEVGISAATPDDEDSREAVRTATREKDDFLAMVGHELRNPLATVSTMLQALFLRGPSREVELMERAVRQLTRLVEDLLESSRLSRGKIQLHKTVVELAQIVDRAVEHVTPLFEDNRHKVSVSVPRVGLRVEADAERLARAIANVLTNSAQHTPAGRRIMIEAVRTAERVRLRIADEGSGIAPDRMASVFQAFQAERSSGGLGLGLSIARSVVELHGGTIGVASAGTDKGTECTIELTATGQAAVDPPPVPRTTRRRLLLVEDNDDAGRALKAALEQLGYEVALAHDAPIALNLARTFKPDVALLDLGLPVMDGWELAKRLHGAGGELPVVAVTARDQESDKQRSAELGFAEHLVKPIDLPRLQRIVEELSAARGPH